jgi:hypothetical protein
MEVRIMRCTCKHEYQDKRYGEGKRVHNLAVKAEAWRCTVCGAKNGTTRR